MRAVMLNTPQQSEFLLLLSPQFFKFCLLASNSRDAKLATPKKFKREKNFEGIWVTRSSQENERATMTPSRKNSARSPISAPKRDVGRVSCEASKTMPFAKHDAWFNEHLPTASLRTTRPGGRGPEAESSIWKKSLTPITGEHPTICILRLQWQRKMLWMRCRFSSKTRCF